MKDKTKLHESIRNMKREINAINPAAKLTVDGALGISVGEKTLAALATALKVETTIPVMRLHPIDWVRNEKKTLDPKEISGTAKNNPRIQWYLEHCDNIGGFKDGKLHADEVPWCSALPNAAADACGCLKTNNALASSWDRYSGKSYKKGDKIPEGAIVRIAHPGGHVTLANKAFTWSGTGSFEGLGGNQGNMIKVSSYSQKYIVSIHDWAPKPGVVIPAVKSSSTGSAADGDKESTR